MRITSVMEEWYEPTSEWNSKLPENERVKGLIKYPTVEEYEPIADRPMDMLKNHLIKIEGLVVNNEPVTDGKKLVACRKQDVAEVAKSFYERITIGTELSRRDAKNSGPRSSLPSQDSRMKTAGSS